MKGTVQDTSQTDGGVAPVLVLVVTLVAMTAGSVYMNKVSPVLTNMVSDLGITTADAGMLISIFTLSGIFLSIPMGVLTTKYGAYRAGIFSLAALVVGSAVGAVATTYPLMLASRFIEGIGLMFLATIGPSIVGGAFSNEKRGTAMGILMCFMAIGQILDLNLAPIMAEAGSWRSFWWLSTGLAAVGLVLWVVVIRGVPSAMDTPPAVSGERGEAGFALGQVLRNGGVWLVAAAFFTFMVAHMGAFNFLPTFLTEVGGVSSTTAGSLTSIASVIGIPVGVVGGIIADKVGSRKWPLAVALGLLGVLLLLIPVFPSASYAPMMVLYGCVSMEEAGYCKTGASEVVEPALRSTSTAVVNTAQWAGAFLGSTVFGVCLGSVGWNASFAIMAVVAFVGAVATVLNRRLR
ncbi:MFS transporter [Tractidigestivibacter montrealensis]|uniref:MFS transporter n=1 Tax=Tractidigestivibacter montrealensis TaxID=2972466 RepID=A0ABT1ZB69_9ACTN|nr:MFS transporter [Tractidigestivibacter montrealensis]MCR9037428.1 MFS transporter [Tractidigestivibacter montrealensis]